MKYNKIGLYKNEKGEYILYKELIYPENTTAPIGKSADKKDIKDLILAYKENTLRKLKSIEILLNNNVDNLLKELENE